MLRVMQKIQPKYPNASTEFKYLKETFINQGFPQFKGSLIVHQIRNHIDAIHSPDGITKTHHSARATHL